MSGKGLMEKSVRMISKSGMWLSKEKQNIRDMLINSCRKSARVFTLAGEKIRDAKMFAAIKGCNVRTIERSELVYKKQLKEIQHYPNIFGSNESFDDWVMHCGFEFPFDLLYLDFQGIWNRSLETSIDRMFSAGVFNRECIVGLTLLKGRDDIGRIKDTRCVINTCCGRFDEYYKNREAAISATFIDMAKNHSIDFKEIYQKTYNNSSGRKGANSAMMFWIFKVV